MKKNPFSMTMTALFLALVLLLGLTPFGMIPLGFINVTILCVPVIVGTVLLGLRSGLLLGACFGVVSALSAVGLSLTPPSALAAPLVARSPLLALTLCLVPRLMVPVVAWGVYRLAAHGEERVYKALPLAAIAGSVTNTVLYLGMMLLFYTVTGLDNAKLLGIIGGTGLIVGGSEAIVAALTVTPIVAALWKVKAKR
ncbi:MAG: ECF transporter S component [Clostridia bacterium]